MHCLGAVLAGGASRRMGVDKAFIEIDGTPMVVRAAVALQDAGVLRVVVVGGDHHRMGALGLRVVPDQYPSQGPLGAVITALDALDAIAGPAGTADAVVTLPCDVVDPSSASVRAVLGRLGESDAPATSGPSPRVDAVVPVGGGQPQWLHAAWRLGCRARLEAAYARGVRAPRAAAGEVRAEMLEIPGEAWFRDADRPGHLPERARPGTAQCPDGGGPTMAGA